MRAMPMVVRCVRGRDTVEDATSSEQFAVEVGVRHNTCVNDGHDDTCSSACRPCLLCGAVWETPQIRRVGIGARDAHSGVPFDAAHCGACRFHDTRYLCERVSVGAHHDRLAVDTVGDHELVDGSWALLP